MVVPGRPQFLATAVTTRSRLEMNSVGAYKKPPGLDTRMQHFQMSVGVTRDVAVTVPLYAAMQVACPLDRILLAGCKGVVALYPDRVHVIDQSL